MTFPKRKPGKQFSCKLNKNSYDSPGRSSSRRICFCSIRQILKRRLTYCLLYGIMSAHCREGSRKQSASSPRNRQFLESTGHSPGIQKDFEKPKTKKRKTDNHSSRTSEVLMHAVTNSRSIFLFFFCLAISFLCYLFLKT